MSGSLIETRKHRGYTIEVHYDMDSGSSSPRDWDNGTKLCLTARGYKLPNEGDLPFDDFGDMSEMVAYVKANFEVVGEVYPVSMTDHSGTSYYLGSPRDPWDSGYVGVIFATAEGQKECGFETSAVEEVCKDELETFTQWANGYVYGYVIKDPGGREIDDGSLWDIYDNDYGFPYVLGTAKSAVDWDIDHINKSLASLGLS